MLNSTWPGRPTASTRPASSPCRVACASRNRRHAADSRPRSAAGRRRPGTSLRSAPSSGFGLGQQRASPRLRLLMHERIVQQDQRLGRHVRHVATADRGERDRRVEGEQERRQEIAAHRQVDAAPAVAVERAARRPAAAFHGRASGRPERRAKHRRVEPAGDGEHRVADRFAFEPPQIRMRCSSRLSGSACVGLRRRRALDM